MNPLLFELSAAPGLAAGIAKQTGAEVGELSRRQFPDGESYLRFLTPVQGRALILLCTLDRPDPKLATLLFAAAAARDQGATSIGLVAPYLAYMRQDKAFQPGEAVTSITFARLLSKHFDWLVTVDPHLHRYGCLSEIYSIPTFVASSADAIASWIMAEVDRPFLIGPDEESRQWVDRIAQAAGARATVLRKVRSGDFSVSIDPNGIQDPGDVTPVIIDDIASSARTMIEAVRLVRSNWQVRPNCIVVHPIFALDAYQELVEAGAASIVSTSTVQHQSNAIDLVAPLAAAVSQAASIETN